MPYTVISVHLNLCYTTVFPRGAYSLVLLHSTFVPAKPCSYFPHEVPIPQWLRFHRPFFNLRINSFRPFFVLILLRNPCLLFRTRCDGLYVSRGPHLICMLPRAGCADILPARSSVLVEGSTLVDGAPGAARACGEDVHGRIGLRGVRREMERLGRVRCCWRSGGCGVYHWSAILGCCASGLKRVAEDMAGRAATRRHCRAFIVSAMAQLSRWQDCAPKAVGVCDVQRWVINGIRCPVMLRKAKKFDAGPSSKKLAAQCSSDKIYQTRS